MKRRVNQNGRINQAGRCFGVEPAALLGDAHGEHLVFAAVDVADKVAHRDTADLVFAGHPAEQQRHTHFICRLHDISLLFIKPPVKGRLQTGKMPFRFIIQYLRPRCKQNAKKARWDKKTAAAKKVSQNRFFLLDGLKNAWYNDITSFAGLLSAPVFTAPPAPEGGSKQPL